MKQLAKAEISNQNGEDIDKRFGILNRWTYLMMQIFEAKSFLDLAEGTHNVHQKSSMEELLTQQALFRGFLMSYGKCFASTGKGRSKLEAPKVFEEESKLVPIHERIMALRNSYAAHNGSSGLDEAIIDVAENGKEFIVSHRYAFAVPLNEYEDYRCALLALEEYVVIQTNRAADSLEKMFGKSIKLKNG